jgi:peptide/nickel transport system permease protein
LKRGFSAREQLLVVISFYHEAKKIGIIIDQPFYSEATLSLRWFFNRGITSIMVLFAALVINFAIPRLMPGNPVDIMTGGVKLTKEARQAVIERFRLDDPVWEQFYRYVINAFQGDFGVSFFYYPQPVTEVMMEALPWSLLILFIAMIFQVSIGYYLGVTAAWKAGSKTDSILQTVSLFIFSTPLFWVAMVLLYFFGYRADLFPISGAYSIGEFWDSTFDEVMDILHHAALPVISLVIAQYATYQLILRNSMVNVLKEQYILTAEAKGLSKRRIKHFHAARNALLPMVTFLSLSFAWSLGGSVFVETVFSYPGIGKLIFDSVISRDYPLLQGCFFLFSVVVIIANLLVDIIYKYLDPRITF